MTQTEKILVKMLKEKTGAHFLDSGGAYGRHWERNQTRRFSKEPDVKLDVWAHKGERDGKAYETVELNPSISTFHFLSDALEYAEKEDRAFQAYMRRKDNEDKGYLQMMEEFAESRSACNGWDHPHTFNTYNGECWLDQTLQGVMCGEYEGFVILQIHQGCDVRGGYGKPRVFRYNYDWDRTLSDVARASLFCKGDPKHGWTLEPGYSQGWREELALDSFPVHALDKDESATLGKLCGGEHKAYCPICGAELEATF